MLIVDDPDAPDPRAPKMTWVHWVLANLPVDSGGLPEGIAPAALPTGTVEGLNDWKRTGYGGPCPPIGRHRYFHKLYALDVTLGGLKHPTKAQVEIAMKGHVLAHAELGGHLREGGTIAPHNVAVPRARRPGSATRARSGPAWRPRSACNLPRN